MDNISHLIFTNQIIRIMGSESLHRLEGIYDSKKIIKKKKCTSSVMNLELGCAM